MSHLEYHRTIWLSDVHLGSRACRAALLADFLANTKCDILYLVGDIIDLRSLRRSFFWPKSHTDILQQILHKSREGTRVLYIPGNHDDDLRALAGTRFGAIEIEQQMIHTTADGRRLLVLHGDEFDGVLKCGALAALAGCLGYRLLLALNRLNHWLNDVSGRPYWSLAQSLKMRVGKAVRYVGRFRQACLNTAREAGVDGVVCGHIHKADIIERDGLLYCNDGDWVESCTAMTESHQGELALCHWRQLSARAVRRLPIPLVSDAA
jgi:UDP-2,3-diacylglucosamine pyrophosphatase LpxH